jgi:hypothetical protein
LSVPPEETDTPDENVEVEVGDGDGVPEEATGEPAVADESDLPSAEVAFEPPLEVEPEEELSGNKQVLFADAGLTVHVKLANDPVGKDPFTGEDVWDTRSETLAPGQSLVFDTLPPYVQKAAKEGGIPFARVVTASEARRLSAEAEHIRLLAGQTVGVESDMVTEEINVTDSE